MKRGAEIQEKQWIRRFQIEKWLKGKQEAWVLEPTKGKIKSYFSACSQN
jgi:hypothetical protein